MDVFRTSGDVKQNLTNKGIGKTMPPRTRRNSMAAGPDLAALIQAGAAQRRAERAAKEAELEEILDQRAATQNTISELQQLDRGLQAKEEGLRQDLGRSLRAIEEPPVAPAAAVPTPPPVEEPVREPPVREERREPDPGVDRVNQAQQQDLRNAGRRVADAVKRLW